MCLWDHVNVLHVYKTKLNKRAKKLEKKKEEAADRLASTVTETGSHLDL